jgi:hypothetical protein
MIKIPLVRRDGSKVRRRILRADEGVRAAFAFGDVVDVALVLVNDLVQMSTPVLADAEPMRFGAPRRPGESRRRWRKCGNMTVSTQFRDYPLSTGFAHS